VKTRGFRQFELVKYKTGWRGGHPNAAYKAFCLTPACAPHEVELPDGTRATITNRGRAAIKLTTFSTPATLRSGHVRTALKS